MSDGCGLSLGGVTLHVTEKKEKIQRTGPYRALRQSLDCGSQPEISFHPRRCWLSPYPICSGSVQSFLAIAFLVLPFADVQCVTRCILLSILSSTDMFCIFLPRPTSCNWRTGSTCAVCFPSIWITSLFILEVLLLFIHPPKKAANCNYLGPVSAACQLQKNKGNGNFF